MLKEIENKIEQILENDVTRDIGYRAHSGTSFDPEKRAIQEQERFKKIIISAYEDIKKLITDENKIKSITLFNEFIDGTKKRFISLLHSKGNCYSVMITGGANFNDRKHEKMNNIERAKSDDLYSFIEWKIKKIKKALAPAPKSTKEQLEAERELHRLGLELNKLARKKLSREEKINEALKITDNKIMLKEFAWNLDNNSKFYTVNSNQKIKRLELKLKKEEALSNTENKTQKFNGWSLVFNYGLSRYQILFDDIPDDETRTKLKSLAFIWSQKNEAWQVHLTNNGRYKVGKFRDWYNEYKV